MLQVNISGQSNEKLTIDVDPDETKFNNTFILILKSMIIKQKRIPVEPENIRLIFAGKPLENSKRFKDYGIYDKATILYVVRLPGGSSAFD